MSSTYENFGVTFLYPENWKITDQQTVESPFEVSLQSPGGGYWMLRTYSQLESPVKLLDEVVRTIKSEYQEVEVEPFSDTFDDTEVQGREMNFYFLDLVVTAKAYCFSAQRRTFVIHTQAETKEFDRSEPVFRAMMLSLLRSADDA